MVTSSPSSGTISKHFLSSSDSLSSSTFYFLDLSCSSSFPSLFELFSCAVFALSFFVLSSTNSVLKSTKVFILFISLSNRVLVSTKDNNNVGQARKEKEPGKDYILLPLWTADLPFPQEPKNQEEKANVNNTNRVNVVSSAVNAANIEVNVVGRKSSIELLDDPNMPEEDVSIFEDSNEDVFGAEADLNNLESTFQIDVKSDFLHKKIEEELYVCQPPGFEDPDFPDKVYKVEKALYGLHQSPRAWPDIMFLVCACARYQVNPKVSHLHAVERLFRYLKSQTKLGLWYLKDSPFDLMAYTDSDYAGASLDRKSTTGGCQFLGCILISWQCKKQTVVANSTTEAEYVAASRFCGQDKQKKSVSLVIEMLLVKELELILVTES
uniref:Putative ribonuclease H-like domain-containing protein n=1 Tax=Tanacetum cinerariifolium TaxID=118510 RepID=A0A6L2MZ51_TANCI|nr:putative ribonuclease H-like domain-containing protein [Tanacetum cinerariifolium]